MKNTLININDQALVANCLKGKRAAQKVLYEKYARAMYHTILRMTADQEGAKDLLQDSFIKVFKQLKNFKGESSLGAWIKKICINTTFSYLKKDAKFQIVELDGTEIEVEDQRKVILDVKKIHHCIMNLPKGCRLVINLYLFEGYRHDEIAEILNISISTSKSQYQRAKKLLKKELNTAVYEKG